MVGSLLLHSLEGRCSSGRGVSHPFEGTRANMEFLPETRSLGKPEKVEW